jgi:hypothetical protein
MARQRCRQAIQFRQQAEPFRVPRPDGPVEGLLELRDHRLARRLAGGKIEPQPTTVRIVDAGSVLLRRRQLAGEFRKRRVHVFQLLFIPPEQCCGIPQALLPERWKQPADERDVIEY